MADGSGGRAKLFSGVIGALSHKDYRRYATGHVIHVHGWWCSRLGVGWLTWELTHSATWLGILIVASMLPIMLIAPFAGAVADRYGHKLTAISAGLVGLAVTGVIGGLALSGDMTLDLLVWLTILQGLFFGIEFPARQAIIPQLVGKENISSAVAFNSTTFQVGTFLGPLLAATLIEFFNTGASILVYCGTTLWMMLMLRLIDVDRLSKNEDRSQSLIADMRAGILYVWDEKGLVYLFMMAATTGFFLRPYQDMLPGFADAVFNQGASGLGALTSASGFGALFLSFWMVIRTGTKGLVKILVIAAFLTALSLIAFSQTPIFIAALPLLAIASGALLSSQVAIYSLVQTISRPDMRGRVISLNISIIMGAPALGALFIGWLADRIGLSNAVMAAAGIALLVLALVSPAILRRRHDIEGIIQK